MARHDLLTPPDILAAIDTLSKKGFFVQRLNDKKLLAQHCEAVLGDKAKARAIYDEIRQDIKKPFPRAPTGGSRKTALFLRSLQRKNTGSFVDHPTVFWLEVERAKHILRHLAKEGLTPRYPLRFLDRVKTGTKLKHYFRALLRDSKNNENELNLAVTGLPALKSPGFYPFSKDWDDAYFACLAMWQDPKTGYWGPRVKKGKAHTLPDLSTTFHIIRAYYDKNTLRQRSPRYPLRHKARIAQTTWQLQRKDYPHGWLEQGTWSTHHNWDVAEIFLHLFNDLTPAQKAKVRALFHKFLAWDVANIRPNGGFIGYYPHKKKPTLMYTNFAVLLLRSIGYFSPTTRERIWTGTKLPVNSYRIYRRMPSHEFDTSCLKRIVQPSREIADPLHLRYRIHRYWKAHKHENPTEALNINDTLQFERLPPRKIRIARKITALKKDELLVAVDKYGGIVWTRTA